MGEIEFGKCDVCGKYGAVERTYYHYGIKCACHLPEHFEMVRTCQLCEPREPKETKLILSTEYLKKISAILCKEAETRLTMKKSRA